MSAIVTVIENLRHAQRNSKLAALCPTLRAAAGLYPAHLDSALAQEMISFIHQEYSRLVAIGEVGLDYWAVKEESDKGLQGEIFMETHAKQLTQSMKN